MHCITLYPLKCIAYSMLPLHYTIIVWAGQFVTMHRNVIQSNTRKNLRMQYSVALHRSVARSLSILPSWCGTQWHSKRRQTPATPLPPLRPAQQCNANIWCNVNIWCNANMQGNATAIQCTAFQMHCLGYLHCIEQHCNVNNQYSAIVMQISKAQHCNANI